MTPDERWEAGIEHSPRSVMLIEAMRAVDTNDNADLEIGGDGYKHNITGIRDNGETLAYLIDELLDRGWISLEVHKGYE